MKKKEIMIIEDDDDIRDLIGYILNKTTYQLKMYDSAAAFNRELDRQLPDLIVLDIMLPDGNGIELCRQLKSNPATQHIPVLLMSALNEPEQTACADFFISKPFNIAVFRSAVEQHL